MKKCLAFFVAIVMLVVSCIPCADSKASLRKEMAKTVMMASTGESNSFTDICPPFCQCNCCAGFASGISLPAAKPPFIQHTKPYPVIPVMPVAKMAYAVWQPPRLSA